MPVGDPNSQNLAIPKVTEFGSDLGCCFPQVKDWELVIVNLCLPQSVKQTEAAMLDMIGTIEENIGGKSQGNVTE